MNNLDPHTYRYIGMVNAIPRLSRERELELAAAWKQHRDQAAADEIVRANLRHVVPQALRYRRHGPSLGDLIAQGNLALMTALDRFEPERGLRFITYANHWIRAEMLSLVLQTRSMVGGGRGHQRGRYVFRLRREHAHLTARHGETDEVCAILAERFGRPADELAEIVALLERRDSSLDVSVGESGTPLGELLPHPAPRHDEVVARDVMQSELGEAVHQATSDLDERERFIVEHRLMADDDARQSLLEIGRRFGVSRERARQIEARVKDKLKKRLKPLASRWELPALKAA